MGCSEPFETRMALRKFTNVFGRSKTCIIGMVHLQPLPGSPKNTLPVSEIAERALKETEVYLENGIDAVMIENMHDVPYICGPKMGPEVVSSIASIAVQIRQKFSEAPLGVQILTAANKEALAVAKCADLDFIRAEGFVFSHIGDEGWINSCAGSLLRYRQSINANQVLIFTDIKKKHSSHAITSDVTLPEVARAAEFFLSDGVIITGSETGVAADQQDIRDLKGVVDIPVLVGSGVTIDNVQQFTDVTGLIIGSHFKEGGCWRNNVDHSRVARFMDKVKALRG